MVAHCGSRGSRLNSVMGPKPDLSGLEEWVEAERMEVNVDEGATP